MVKDVLSETEGVCNNVTLEPLFSPKCFRLWILDAAISTPRTHLKTTRTTLGSGYDWILYYLDCAVRRYAEFHFDPATLLDVQNASRLV